MLVYVSCSVKYSFTGTSISAKTKTFQVNYFQNNSALVEPGIDRDFTNKLIDLGYKFADAFSSIGRVDAIYIDQDNKIYAAADPRGDDYASGE